MKRLIIPIFLIIFVQSLSAQTASWSPLFFEMPKPSARHSMSMCYLSPGKVLLFGGMGNEGCLGDTWIFDTGDSNWHEVLISGTKPSSRFASGFVSLGNGNVLLFGGSNDENIFFNDIWIFHGADSSWTEVPTVLKPSARMYPAMVCLNDTSVLLCGGSGLATFDDVWNFNLATMTWRSLGNMPQIRNEPAMCKIGMDKAALIGGDGFYDIWIYDISGNTWSYRNPSEHPPITSRNTALYLGGDIALILIANNEESSTETWIYHGETNVWNNLSSNLPVSLPMYRYGLAEISHTGTSRVIFFGGQEGLFMTPVEYPFIFNCDPSVLPVELMSFTASTNNNKIELKWKTATEVNNYGFEIERNTPLNPLSRGDIVVNPLSRGDERGVWEKVGFIPGAGNSNSPRQYSFTDENPPDGNIQYRLKQIDTDAKYQYYPQIAEVKYSLTDVKEKQLPTEFSLEQNYPNPFNPSTVISYQLPVPGNVSLKVYDILGKEVAALVNENKQAGYYQVEFNANYLSSGIYIYRLITGNFVSTKKLILER